MIIGITGSSGAGKSTVCEILKKEYNAQIIDADKISKQLSKKGTIYLEEIVEKFGKEILLENGELDRKKLAEIIYSSDEKREILNNCTLKHIKEKIKQEVKKLKNNKKIIAIDAPLLFEAKLDEICEFVIAVISDNLEVQIERITKRDGITEEQAMARLKAQKPNDFYTQKSSYAIVNNGKIEEIEKQIMSLLGQSPNYHFCRN